MAFRNLSPSCLAVVQAVRAWLEAACEYPVAPVRIGVSGGVDSMSLAAACAHVKQRSLPEAKAEAMIVDHQLQESSGKVAEYAAQQLRNIGLPARVERVNVVDDGVGMEAAARDARYAALTDHFKGMLLLAHSMDDQAETVLLGLSRGSGTRSMAGMAVESIRGETRVVRPLLGLRAQTLRQAAVDWGIDFWDDPQNAQDRFARVRARKSSLPTLEKDLGPGFTQALARTATMAGRDADYLDAVAERELPNPGDEISVEQLAGLHPAIATRVLRRWLNHLGIEEVGFDHVEAVFRLVSAWKGQRGVDLPGSVRIRRAQGRLQAVR
ncbi:tRNA lysidine(34) synthetase TilS [Propionimicrobium lymphophilum]|uniref:tRNA(Ile)-lysidine synthase n=1 Tax=Propionimicrobium lymphophilum ACS-093-V-SCH5 TaxID=883161 RepID=S2WX77_9ACTN|nr:tRNA lysidine(34) synthetase TilS [Propionimicrobium lymphophilum]EPD32354.1 tRNA(Ile)-lysidine synthetase [Propionimicrobium lymphophilum ACS-093-V-SCH5]MDK7710882.1 tRNA lysidine(34) synthetase TilS [Propionimicrobium lymphophilum]MDK7734669.1 tRNA lysidine(34) synthetase TilS [Propionimicrobium lymphophilum]